MKTLENEITDLKKTETEIKTLLTTKQSDSDHPIQPSLIASRQEPPPKPAEELDSIPIRGIPESTEKEARLRQERDLAEVKKVLAVWIVPVGHIWKFDLEEYEIRSFGMKTSEIKSERPNRNCKKVAEKTAGNCYSQFPRF